MESKNTERKEIRIQEDELKKLLNIPQSFSLSHATDDRELIEKDDGSEAEFKKTLVLVWEKEDETLSE